MVYNLWSPSRIKNRDSQVKTSSHERAMSSGSTASVTVSNAEAERLQLSPQSQWQLPPQLQKVSEESGKEFSQSIKDTPDASVQGEAGREPNSKDGSLVVSRKPATSGKQKEEENLNVNGIQEKKEQEEHKENSVSSREDEGYAPNLFYAYARRIDTDKPNNHLYLLTFTSASTLPLFLSTVHSAFPDSQISRDAPQLLTFKGSDILEKAWKADKHIDLKDLKRKWFYTPLTDMTAKTQPILPFQDEKGWLIGPQIAAAGGIGESMPLPLRPSFSYRTPSTKGKEKKSVGFADQLLSSSGDTNNAAAAAAIDTLPKLTKQLDRVSTMLETSASQIKALESAQETTYDTLASTLETSIHQIQQLTLGQQKFIETCEELKKAIKEKEEMWRGGGVGGLGSGSNASTVSCGHEVHRPPRKVERKVVGYVYEEMERHKVGEKEK